MNRTVFALPARSDYVTRGGLAITRVAEQFTGGANRLDDLINLCEGLRAALPSVVDGDAMGHAVVAIDEAVAQYRWHRRLAGDARKRNAFLQFIYKGA